MRPPLISVITVCKNSEEYIEQCIRSVLEQSHHDYEYIIIDGDSTDTTVRLIEGYSSNITYWHSKPDRGLGHAFNLGLQHSTGKWIIYLNSDDYFINTNILEDVAPYLIANSDSDVIYGQVNVVSQSDKYEITGGPYGSAFEWSAFAMSNTIPHQAAFTSRLYFQRVGEFSEEFEFAMDYEHYLRGGHHLNAVCMPVVVANMRDGGISQNNKYSGMIEWARAQYGSGVRSLVMAYSGCALNFSRIFFGGIYRHVRNILVDSRK